MSILLKPFLHVSWNQRQPSCFDSVEVKITGTAKILTEKSAETEINSSGLKTIWSADNFEKVLKFKTESVRKVT